MRNSMDSGFNEIKELKGRRGIRDRSEEVNFANNRIKLNNNEDRSNSEPPRSYGSYLPATSHRLKTIREKKIREDAHGSSDEDGELSKSNSQLNESDLDMEIPDSASASVSQTPTPTPLVSSNARRINSETNLNDSKRRLSGFMGNRSKRFCASTSELSFTSHLDTHKSLFSPKNNALSRQSFNSSLYGSNMSLSSTNSRLFMANSPFYNGKTMFGGASAYPKRDINQHKILRTPVQMRPSSSLSNSSNTSAKSDNIVPESNAAKRILEIMNQFSGPLKEARSMGNNINSIIKVPSLVQSRKRYGEDELNLDRSIALSTPSAPYGRPLSGAPSKNRPESPLFNSASAKPLQIPTMSQLLQMKRLQNNTEKVREIASRSDSFLNQNHEYKLPSTGDESHSNSTSGASLKMKSNITKNLLRPDKNSANDQLPALPLNLPNIQLPAMKSIPKFDIQLPSVSAVCSKPSPPALTRSSLAMPTVNAVSKVPEVQFNFQNSSGPSLKEKSKEVSVKKNSFVLSKPLPAGDGSVNASTLNHINEKFIFSKPIIIDDDDEDEVMSIVAKSPVKSTLSSPITDNLFKSLVAQQKSSSWECDSCLTRNDAGKTNCVCCDSVKPGTGKATQPPAVAINSNAPAADDLFKNLAAKQKQSQWECDSCMTKNDVSKDKCGCCETPKPGSKPAPTPVAPVSKFTFGITQPASTNDDLFKNLAAQQKKSQWECEACMSRNDASKDVCACCTTLRPGAKPQPAAATPSFSFGMKPAADSTVKPTFSFGMPQATSTSTSDAGFKKIVEKQSASWECSACLTRNESTKMECVCCEQAKPGSGPATPQFSFGSKMTSSVSLPAPSEVKFSFGMQAAKVDAPVETKKVEEPAKVPDEVDKPPPTFSFGMNNSSATEKAKPSEATTEVAVPSFTFKSPAPTPSVTASFALKPAEKKDEEKKEEAKPAAPMFSFGAQKSAPVVENKITFGTEIKAAEPIAAKQPEKEEVKKPDFGGFKFGADTPAAPVTQAPAPALNKNGGFSFGFGAKPAEAPPAIEPIKTAPAALPSATSGFSFGSSTATSTFGSQPAAASSPNSFFGASKPENEAPKAFGSFGATSSPSNTTFGMASTQSTPVFGQKNTSAGAFSFSAKKEEPAPAQQPSIFAFGAKPTATESAPMLFGNANQTNQAQNVTPVFGASSTPTFGSTMSTNNNNESGFGSKMPSFGNPGQPQKRAFEFTADQPQTKKFDFGGQQQQQQQQQQASATPFQFNAQANENKPAFNFGASSQPSFNFSNPAANNAQDPQNCFQFGANNNNSNQGIFAFAPATAPPIMQFGSGAPQPQMGLPGITSFTAQGTTSGAAANQRKILRANRRARR